MPYVFIIKINYLIIIGKLTQEHVEIYWLFSVFWNILSQFPIGDFNSLCIFLKKNWHISFLYAEDRGNFFRGQVASSAKKASLCQQEQCWLN